MNGDFGEQARSVTAPVVRDATLADLPRLLELYASLALDPGQEAITTPVPAEYVAAFEDVIADPRQRLLVVEADGWVAGSAVLLIIPNLTHRGRPYAIVENVVIDQSVRGGGVGGALMRYIIDQARKDGCYKLALTSAVAREGAHRFYERLGFVAKHKGFRIDL